MADKPIKESSYQTPRDEFVRSLDRNGRGATLIQLAKKWGYNLADLKIMYVQENWNEQRESYLSKIAYYVDDASAKNKAQKLIAVDAEADNIYQVAIHTIKHTILRPFEFCGSRNCKEPNPNIDYSEPQWKCMKCGRMNIIEVTALNFKYMSEAMVKYHDQRRKIYGGDKLEQSGVNREQFEEQRRLYEWDLLGFAKAFFPHLVPDYFCQLHIDSAQIFKAIAGERGYKEVIAAPRGYAKTTFDVTIGIIHDCVYAHEKFVLVISSTSSLSEDKVKAIRDEMDTNSLLKLVYGEMKGPKWNQDDFVTSTGVRVKAVSPKTQVRGLNDRGNRPTKIVLDDAENSEHVQTQLQREKMRKWFFEDISKLGTRMTNIKLVGTSLHIDALLEELFKNAGYKNRRYRAVINFSDESAQPLWEEWKNILMQLDNPNRMNDADEFYRNHEAEMSHGSKVLWPERETYVELMKMRLFEGNTAFQLEKQNNPLAEDRLMFDMDNAGYFDIGVGRIIRDDGRVVSFMDFSDKITAFLDPIVGQGEESDYAACVVTAQDYSGFIYCMEAFLKQWVTPNEQINATVDLLWRWKVTKMGIESNGFQSLLIVQLREAIAAKALAEKSDWSVKIVPVTNLRAKPIRISTMEPSVENRHLWFSNGLPPEAIEQMKRFRPLPDAGHDDFPDALEGSIRVLRGTLK